MRTLDTLPPGYDIYYTLESFPMNQLYLSRLTNACKRETSISVSGMSLEVPTKAASGMSGGGVLPFMVLPFMVLHGTVLIWLTHTNDLCETRIKFPKILRSCHRHSGHDLPGPVSKMIAACHIKLLCPTVDGVRGLRRAGTYRTG
jgi:hypothetical protein